MVALKSPNGLSSDEARDDVMRRLGLITLIATAVFGGLLAAERLHMSPKEPASQTQESMHLSHLEGKE